ncbi:MAG TPA: response regulator transcription factor, partial [Saprospiraceae bacterium]|nr:response regulator transcription factor [Saprospiraceae bacterium]
MKKKVSLTLQSQTNNSVHKQMASPHILIADDHAVIRTGLKYLLARHFTDVITGEADACSTLTSCLEKESYTHLILDMQLGDCNSLELIPNILAAHPDLMVMVYTMSPEAIYGKRLLQMGVLSFLSKEEEEETLINALTLFLEGRPYISESLRSAMEQEQGRTGQSANPFDELSEREMAVFRFLLQGLRVKEIANRLDLKMSTVATYKVRIFEKLNVNNVADMHRLA